MSLRPDTKVPKALYDLDGAVYRLPIDREEHIARLDTGALTRGTGNDVKRLHTVLSVEPGYAIVRSIKGKALLEIDNAEGDGCHGEKRQSNRC
jgi:hypothetical protein